MAASKRRQDEKHLKILRELGSLLPNKQCFDCHQRGPTYVNMTIGSFVCTSCSGILRGLNPPHRVKSISMASFTPDEIEFIKSKGNEICQREWMGTYDGSPPLESESKDEQRIKDFMAMKYERKRWYVDPSSAAFRSSAPSQSNSYPPPPIPDSRPLTTLVGNHVKPLVVQQNNNNNNTQPIVSRPMMQSSASFPPATIFSSSTRPSMDLLSDLGGDPFASTNASNSNAMNNANASFANFDHFASDLTSDNSGKPFGGSISSQPISSSFGSLSAKFQASTTSPPPGSQQPSSRQPPTIDRYAALADLDNMFHTMNVPFDEDGTSSAASANTGAVATPWAINGTSQSPFAGATPTPFPAAPPSSNPFTGTAPSASAWNQPHIAAPAPRPGNPFASAFGSSMANSSVSHVRTASPPAPFGPFPNHGAVQGSYATTPSSNPNVGFGWGGGGVGVPGAAAVPGPFAVPQTNGGYPGYKMAVPSPFGAWQPSTGNPFMGGVNATSAPQKSNSSNPFL